MVTESYSPKFKYFRRNEDQAQHVLFTSRPPHCVHSHEVYGHFSACIRENKEMLLAGKLLKSNGYDVEKDIAERLLHSSVGAAQLLAYSGLKYIVMSEDKFQKMVKSGVALKDIKAIVESMEEGGFIEGRDVHDKPKEKERPVHKEQEVQVYKLGDTKCVNVMRILINPTYFRDIWIGITGDYLNIIVQNVTRVYQLQVD